MNMHGFHITLRQTNTKLITRGIPRHLGTLWSETYLKKSENRNLSCRDERGLCDANCTATFTGTIPKGETADLMPSNQVQIIKSTQINSNQVQIIKSSSNQVQVRSSQGSRPNSLPNCTAWVRRLAPSLSKTRLE